MIAFPHAKINLGLNVIRKRADGFHDIESILVPVPLRDALEVVIDDQLPAGAFAYSRTGIPIDGDLSNDLVMRAHALLSKQAVLPGMRAHLHKCIPLGAGLGGGSSDGAFALKLMNTQAHLGLGTAELMRLAAKLGSDCAFFLADGPQLARGRGEELTPVALDLSGAWLVLVNPGVHVATALAYQHAAINGEETGYARILERVPIEQWRDAGPNGLEPFVFKTWPIVEEAIARLRASGAAYAAMSGSGSTVFGIFRTVPPNLEWPEQYRSWSMRLGEEPR